VSSTHLSDLTGPHTTGKLRRIAPAAVTVTVARTVRAGEEAFFADWSGRMVAAAEAFPGCLGAAALASGPGSSECHMVVRFLDGVSLRAWERSAVRSELLEELDGVVTAERVTTVVGEEEFFASLTAARPARAFPLRVLRDVVWVFPVAVFWSAVGAPRFGALSLPVRTLVSVVVITVVLELALSPVRRRLRSVRGLPVGEVRSFDR